jgi:hypothetical protein
VGFAVPGPSPEPAVSSYLTVSPLPRALQERRRRSLLCGTFPILANAGRYPAPCPAVPGLSSLRGAESGRPASFRRHLKARGRSCKASKWRGSRRLTGLKADLPYLAAFFRTRSMLRLPEKLRAPLCQCEAHLCRALTPSRRARRFASDPLFSYFDPPCGTPKAHSQRPAPVLSAARSTSLVPPTKAH